VSDNSSLLNHSYIESLIHHGAWHGNILPLTSRCNVRCVFCSNLLNPPGVEVYNIKPRSIDQVRQTLAVMDQSRPVVIGESVTRINEGEPFTHPRIEEIFIMIRSTFPRTPLQITTNGSLLDKERVVFLRSLAPLTVYLSLNSADTYLRARVMRDPRAQNAVAAAKLLGRYGVSWHGSVVAMPHLTGWNDLHNTIHYLARCGAQTIRVFIPGFTRLAPPELRFPAELPGQLDCFIRELRPDITVPVTLEPPLLGDLRPEVAGVLSDSPAHRAGLRNGDVINTVNGVVPFSRVHAFHLVKGASDPVLALRRPDGTNITVTLQKTAGARSGLVMDFDIDPGTIREIKRAITRHEAANTLVLTSALANNIIRSSLHCRRSGPAIYVLPVTNSFFGGFIKTAGLLVVADMLEALRIYLTRHPRPDLVLLPQVAFDHHGRDLTGRSWLEIEQQFNLPVEIL